MIQVTEPNRDELVQALLAERLDSALNVRVGQQRKDRDWFGLDPALGVQVLDLSGELYVLGVDKSEHHRDETGHASSISPILPAAQVGAGHCIPV